MINKFFDALLILFFVVLFLSFSVTQNEAAMAPELDAIIYENLRTWAVQHGAKLDKLHWPMTFPKTGRGVAAAKNITSQEKFIEIPLKLCIRRATAFGSPLEAVVARLSDYLGAVVVLLHEKQLNETSFYKPFLDYLQIDYDMLEYWSDDELSEFHDPRLVHEAKTRIDILKKDYREVMYLIKRHGPQLTHLHSISQELFSWAWHTVGTRSFGFFDGSDDDSRPTLVPIADLLNYNQSSTGSWHDKNGAIEIMSGAGDGFNMGEEVTISYGSETHFETMLHYGFVSPGNHLNYETIFMPPNLPNRDQKIQFNSQSEEHQLRWEVSPFELLAFYRLVTAKDDDLSMETFRYPTTLEREFEAGARCLDDIEKILESKPTTLRNDLKLLEETQKNSGQRNKRFTLALLYRIDQKKIALKNQGFCFALTEDLLPCIPWFRFGQLSYFKQVKNLARKMTNMTFN